MISLQGVSKHYTRDSIGLSDVHLNIEPGEFVSVVGQSGSGKTTLVKLIIAEEEATIIRSAEEKAIIEGRARRKARERGEAEEGDGGGDNEEAKSKPSQEAEPMI